MGFYVLLYWHFLVMVMVMMIFAGMITFICPRFPSIVVLLICGLIGFVYSICIDFKEASLFFIGINLVASSIPILLIRYLLFLKRKAEEMEEQGF
ncbi:MULTISPECIES: hypothetical protein [unclassified Lysinibacillus]|uniref:hypothetical protein n=1 Tax=unclassified Lysinibacillus TaxID=2636778 RepID=UPI002013AC75|nr:MULTISPECIES: hypothetical protein [unclassified Lysinibacillus]MCL1694419.1 hypothetical protein [Lysinibacillus sp. BPa_S21]MCL1699251.1 hypothetical protein [Lysinibacillus sp. Bpr_S20]